MSGGTSQEVRFWAHVRHEVAHESLMNCGFFVHSPASAHLLQSGSLSPQSKAACIEVQRDEPIRQRPHAAGQAISIAVLLLTHSPAASRDRQPSAGSSLQPCRTGVAEAPHA